MKIVSGYGSFSINSRMLCAAWGTLSGFSAILQDSECA